MYKQKYLFFVAIVFIIGYICVFCIGKRNNTYNTYFAVLPHFAINPISVDMAYKNILETYGLSGSSLEIIIVSPDHFKATKNNVSPHTVNQNLCFQNTCLPIHNIYGDNNYTTPDTFIQEHGRGAHFPFIKKYFPGAKVSLIGLSARDFTYLDTLSKQLQSLEKENNLLVITSVDFSHYTSEQWANIHDIKSYYTLLNSTTQEDYQSIEVDCPSCLFLVNGWAQKSRQYPYIIRRDSSSTLAKKDLGFGNTSRAFILYTGNKIQNNGIVLGFFGDLIFDRGVSEVLDTKEKIEQHFSDRYQEGDTSLNPKFYIHRKGFGLDLLGFNLETPYVTNTCKVQKGGIRFCSSGELLGFLYSIGFNTVTLANNHMGDAGVTGYQETINNVKNNNFDYAGNIHFKGIIDNKVMTKKIRGIDIALHAYNMFNRYDGDLQSYCQDLGEYKDKGYINIISIHRGTEYESNHNQLQENIAKKLIDCGGDMIIGHHPHVIQDIQRYKDKPIIYSLGNFLFDQYFSENTQKGIYVLAHIPLSGNIEIWTGEIKSSP